MLIYIFQFSFCDAKCTTLKNECKDKQCSAVTFSVTKCNIVVCTPVMKLYFNKINDLLKKQTYLYMNPPVFVTGYFNNCRIFNFSSFMLNYYFICSLILYYTIFVNISEIFIIYNKNK